MPEESSTRSPTSTPLISGLKNHTTLVLGSDNQPMGYPLTLLNAKDTVNMLMLDRAEVVTLSNRYILRGDKDPFQLPSVVRLRHNLHNIMAAVPVPFSRFNLAVRDESTCQYTGQILSWWDDDFKLRATFDHVIPKVEGGQTCWLNAVLSSAWANSRKGDDPLETFLEKYKDKGVSLNRRPWEPTPADMLSLAVTNWRTNAFMPEDWIEFLENIEPTARVNRIREGKLYAYG